MQLRAALLAVLLPFSAACGGGGGKLENPTGPASTGSAPPSVVGPSTAPTSIVVLYCDDLRFDVLDAPVDFPALEGLAAEGCRFTRAYVTTSRCCPSRASMLTGRRVAETGVRNNHPERMPELVTLPEVARAQGYRTAWFGKWHLPAPAGGAPPGFDQWAGYPGPGRHFGQTFTDENGLEVETASDRHQADWIFERAERFVEESGDQPFLLFVAPKNPHTPMTPAPRHMGALDGTAMELPVTYDRPEADMPVMERDLRRRRIERAGSETAEDALTTMRRYWELVMAVDEGWARLDAALERAGRRQTTFVLFTSDNGQLLGEHGMIQKGLAYEPSIRVPLVARFPGVLGPGSRCDEFALNIDVFPTLAGLMGAEADASRAPGQSLVGLAQGELQGASHFLYDGPYFDGRVAIEAVVERRLKYVRWNDPDDEALFDLERDPEEANNLSGTAEHAADLSRLRGLLPAR